MAPAIAQGFGATPVPPPWTNQDILLYHGTLHAHVASLLRGVNVVAGRARSDFGRGFYTTTFLAQARNWALQMSIRLAGSQPAVIRFRVNRDTLAKLQTLWFIRGDLQA